MKNVAQEFIIHEPSDLRAVATQLLEQLSAKALLLLSGPMGVGKTTFVRSIAKELGLDSIASPSFAIHHRYQSAQESLDHIDLYRLEDEEDLESSGFWDLFEQQQGWIVIEWADRLDPEFLPEDWSPCFIEFEYIDSKTRRITLLGSRPQEGIF